MQKAKTWFVLSVSLMLVSIAGSGEARSYYTWCKSFVTGENLACSTHTDFGGIYSYTPGTAPKVYDVPDNTLFNVRYEAPEHEKALFSMYVDSNVSSCKKGADCSFSTDKWKTQCTWNDQDAWICTLYHQDSKIPEAKINQYYLQTDYLVRNYIYLAQVGGSNNPPMITAVPAKSYPENTGSLPKIVDLWFFSGDDRTPQQDLMYTIVSQTNPGVVSCTIASNRYIDCLTQPSANGISEVTFSAKDAGGATTSSTFSISITPIKPVPSTSRTESKLILPSTPGETCPLRPLQLKRHLTVQRNSRHRKGGKSVSAGMMIARRQIVPSRNF